MRYEVEKIKKKKFKYKCWQYEQEIRKYRKSVKKSRIEAKQKNELLDREFPKG